MLDAWYKHKYNVQQYDLRPSWTEFFMDIALSVSKRSPDAETQCGAVIVSPSNEIITTGYNGHMRDIPNDVLPNLRPDKYDWMIHAEHNAILSCARQGKSPRGATIYVTHEPCINCYQDMWQVGIKEIVYRDKTTHKEANKHSECLVEVFKSLTADHLTIKALKSEI